MLIHKTYVVFALAMVASILPRSECLADDTGNYFADRSCRGLAADEVEKAKKDGSLLFQCRRTQLDIDMKSGRYDPVYSPTPNSSEFIRCGWKDLNGEFPNNTTIVVQEAGENSWVFHPRIYKTGAAIHSQMQVRWLYVGSKREVPAFDCASGEFHTNSGRLIAKSVDLMKQIFGDLLGPQLPKGCRKVSDGQHPPFIECPGP